MSIKSIFFYMLLLLSTSVFSQHISDFASLAPLPKDALVQLPGTHQFQYLIGRGDGLTLGGVLPGNCDFAGYIPISNSSGNGYLCVNSESAVGAVTVLDISLDANLQSWSIQSSGLVDFTQVLGTSANCSGAVTPWGTMISCEEIMVPDTNGDGYSERGWNIEIDPVTRRVINQPGGYPAADKLWAMGNMGHENVIIHKNRRTAYEGSDTNPGYLFRFVASSQNQLHTGDLYVFRSTGAHTAEWVQLDNSTPYKQSSSMAQASAVGARIFNGIEDVDISPIDSMVYFAVKGESRIYRFRDPNPLSGLLITHFDTFIGGTSYPITTATGTVWEPWGIGNDNLVFDDLGNLWVCQDGDKDYIWLIKPSHTQANPQVSIFARMPIGSEPTGMTFTPDYRYMFLSVQHPHWNNAVSQQDALHRSVTFNRDAVLVIARSEDLGLPLDYPPGIPPSPSDSKDWRLVLRSVGSGKIQLIRHDSFPDQEVEVNIFNLKGEKIASQKQFVNNKISFIDISGFRKNIYIVSVQADNGKYVSKKVVVW